MITVNTTVQNTGSIVCAEVAQLYVSFPEEAEQPVRILRGLEKVNIPAGATYAVSFSLRRRDVSYWDVAGQKWAVARGTYTFSVGSSSRDRGVTRLWSFKGLVSQKGGEEEWDVGLLGWLWRLRDVAREDDETRRRA